LPIPASVHSGQTVEIVTQRKPLLPHSSAIRSASKNRQPDSRTAPEAAWINPSPSRTANESLDQENDTDGLHYFFVTGVLESLTHAASAVRVRVSTRTERLGLPLAQMKRSGALLQVTNL
jgi:hypothetical protein